MKAIRVLASVTVLASLALAACGKEGTKSGSTSPVNSTASSVALTGSATFDKMSARGSVIIGVKEDQPNLGYKDPTTGEYSGFDIEIARLTAGQLGFSADKITFIAIPSANRETEIAAGNVDFYVGTYSITDTRKAKVDFAGPYFIAGQDLLVKKADETIKGPKDLVGKKTCSVTGSTSLKRIKEEYGGDTIELEKYSLCVDQLLDGQVDALTTDDAILLGYAGQDPTKLKVVGAPFSQEKYGIGMLKGDTVLRAKVNDILEAAGKDGSWKKIYDSTLGKAGSTATQPAVDRY
jgi:glutamate transport system substrate-binding protein